MKTTFLLTICSTILFLSCGQKSDMEKVLDALDNFDYNEYVDEAVSEWEEELDKELDQIWEEVDQEIDQIWEEHMDDAREILDN